ncbi:MAG TPA: response regulator [Flavisolibacter sp.]|jgi:CheY-like chemotaxis protein|nr:response regulator [Flavisolibacter sp.]
MKKNYILWADDDQDDLLLMKEILFKNNRNLEIVEVSNGKEALQHLQTASDQSNLPCLIILDINMPVLDGKETLSIIKQTEAYQAIPAVVFTTSNSELDKLFCKKYNVEMITKPPNYKNLEAAVLRMLKFCNLSS